MSDGAQRRRRPSSRRYERRLRPRPHVSAPGSNGHRWVQVNCALFPREVGGPPYVPWEELNDAFERWRAEGCFRLGWFLRKPPGLRLRFRGDDLDGRLLPALVAWLEDAERRDVIRGFRFALYEPEQFRFGGPAGMAIAHDYFDYDSRLALRYETLSDDDRMSLPRDLFSLAVANDLFNRCVEDGAELWDIWGRLWQRVAAAASLPAGQLGNVERERDALNPAPAFVERLTPAAATLLADARTTNEQIAARLHAAIVAERLSVGMRAWLASTCVFHWNRLGLTTEELGPMAARMLALLDPCGDQA